MKTQLFPINYFTHIWTPQKIFQGRKLLKWWQIVFVFLFLNGLLMIPISLNYAKMDDFPAGAYFPETMELIDEDLVGFMQNVEVINGQLRSTADYFRETTEGIVAVGLMDKDVEAALEKNHVLLFLEDHFVLKEGENPAFTVPYPKTFSFQDVTTRAEFQQLLFDAWFIQNKTYIVFSLTLITGTISFISMLFIVLGSALILYFTKMSKLSSIQTFKESINLILNCISLATIVATVIGIIHFNVIVMMMLQTIGLIFMLLAVYYKTQLKDEQFDNAG